MPKIFEIFGYPISDRSEEAEQNRRVACCPFMDRDCDGGGNRYLSQIDLSRNPELKAIFPNRSKLAAGVCSIQVKPNTAPWIVCPRRLLVLGRERAGERTRQKNSEIETLRLLGYPSGTRLGVWPEVKLKYTSLVNDVQMSFDYTLMTSEVNMLSFSYGETVESPTGVIDLSNPQLFAGLMTSAPVGSPQGIPSFQDIIRAPICPPLHRVLLALARRKPINQVIAP